MASYRKNGSRWEAQVARGGVRSSKTFATKAEAQTWAAALELEISSDQGGGIPNKTFGDLMARYAAEVSPKKKGCKWEQDRIALLTREDELASVNLRNLNSTHIAAWRDRRLESVSGLSVVREWAILGNACAIAIREWQWLKVNPTTGVSKPQKESARDRLATQEEIDILVENLGYQKDAPPVTISSRVGASVLFAVETALRASEIARLRWDQVFVAERYAKILGGKTEAAKRDLPLSSEAIRLLQQMPRTSEEVFNIQTSQMDALFRKARGRVLIKGLRYHDLRHTAITRLAKKLDVLALARAIGHKDLKMLLVYYNESASNLAERLR